MNVHTWGMRAVDWAVDKAPTYIGERSMQQFVQDNSGDRELISSVNRLEKDERHTMLTNGGVHVRIFVRSNSLK